MKNEEAKAINGLISQAGLWNTKLKAASRTNESLKGIVHPKICTALSHCCLH